MLIKKLKETALEMDGQPVELQVWVRTNRKSKNVAFIELNDGSCFSNVQIVYGNDMPGFEEASKITTGSAIQVNGKVKATPQGKKPFEIAAEKTPQF